MKQTVRALILLCLATGLANAQQPSGQAGMQFFRYNDQRGVNVFETDKTDTTPFHGTYIHIGGAFADDWQTLKDQNYTNTKASLTHADSGNVLAKLGAGFQLGWANMYLDAQLADGIRTNVTVYLATVHHEDTWVKNGYLQIDKMLFLNSDLVNDIMKYVTIDAGFIEDDYGDAHFRRVDAGNGMFNPFIENYIMDEFATETGAELYVQNDGWLGMVGITNGELNPQIKESGTIDAETGMPVAYDPSILAKVGWDKQVNSDLRVRLTGSYYENQNGSVTLLDAGDRAGSHYSLMMANTAAPVSSNGSEDLTFTQGRFGPGFSTQISTFMINPFIKYDGLEFFGTYEDANGRGAAETATRNATQMAADLIYRFGATQQFWIAVRYNTLKEQLAPVSANIPDVTVNRIAGSVGWYILQSVMMKFEYVSQQYNGFDNSLISASSANGILNGGKFNGIVGEADVAF
ncbi:MAG TPA: hypothetical protein VFD13_10015 [Candidatus Kapabacteria bacterium]|nr:hypothetical protein [Candidatus Kapabacteria bacterium]